MSQLIYLCFRDSAHLAHPAPDVGKILQRLRADNIPHEPPLIIDEAGILCGITHANDTALIHETSICFGNWTQVNPDWHRPLCALPDTFHLLLRSDDAHVEIATDAVGSRTIWYLHNEELFIASTSQRAIVTYLRSFVPEEKAMLWMLSSGTLGPGHAWDKRIHCLPGSSRLLLDRDTWQIKHTSEPIEFQPEARGTAGHQKALSALLEATFDRSRLDYEQWAITLSGGYDSRYIFHQLKGHRKLTSVSWGLQSALNDPNTDAAIAKVIAAQHGVPHQFFPVDTEPVAAKRVFQRFVHLGEGRTDLVSGYRDGFALWKTLHEESTAGIIRGDEGFGWKPVQNQSDVLRSIGLTLLSHYADQDLFRTFGNVAAQELPLRWQQREDESLATWRDRLYHEFRIPYILAPLNNLKSHYVEIINPLLANDFIRFIRTVPDELRTDKQLFKQIVEATDQRMGFAKYGTAGNHWDLLKTAEVGEFLAQELQLAKEKTILPTPFIDTILQGSKVVAADRTGLRVPVNRLVRKLRNRWRRLTPTNYMGQPVDYNRLAFRAYIIYEMHQTLAADATVLPHPAQMSMAVG